MVTFLVNSPNPKNVANISVQTPNIASLLTHVNPRPLIAEVLHPFPLRLCLLPHLNPECSDSQIGN